MLRFCSPTEGEHLRLPYDKAETGPLIRPANARPPILFVDIAGSAPALDIFNAIISLMKAICHHQEFL